MIPAEFSYVRPTSIEEAAQAAGQPGAKVIAGGQSLLPLMKLRLARPSTIVDIGRIPGLSGTHYLPDGGVEMGALTTYAQVIAETQLEWTREALSNVGDVQVRNRGTLGGSIAHADPASDAPAIALALDYSAVLRSPRGERVVPLDGFFTGPFTTTAADDEILVALRRPPLPDGVGGAYEKLAQPASGYAMVGVAVVIGRSEIVGKPMAMLLLAQHATVTICHSRTVDLAEYARRADVLVAAVGRRGLVTPDMVKPGATVIDVGVNRTDEGKLVGDVDPACFEVAGLMTPVPGGVGPLTIAMLLKNTVAAAEARYTAA